ncbi:hypothetical protein C7S16_6363 [Burkholderia thailandensis]|uniref:Uncharacterized protein n=1 Tax=Burkholderia thailandensis TaxID=57975 RepID=A0AAW9CK63_BURTH|nr:hypothetical protein [Burkholderia thailandensis]
MRLDCLNDMSGHLTESSLRCLFTGTFEIQAALRTGRRPNGTACALALHVRSSTTTGPSSFDCLLLSLRLLAALFRIARRRAVDAPM